jgi:hypothetical protein
MNGSPVLIHSGSRQRWCHTCHIWKSQHIVSVTNIRFHRGSSFTKNRVFNLPTIVLFWYPNNTLLVSLRCKVFNQSKFFSTSEWNRLIYGTWNFIALLIKCRCLTSFSASWNQTISSIAISLELALNIICYLGLHLPSKLFQSDFHTNILYVFPIS